MLQEIELKNYGPLSALRWNGLQKINLIIGRNGSGKTFLLKVLYSAMRALEEHQRGHDQRSVAEILAKKLYWTFQSEKIGDLVGKDAIAPLSCKLVVDGKILHYTFGKETSSRITAFENHVPTRDSNSIFLPPKEVLTLQHVILASRERDKLFGFDDTYYDLARALRVPTRVGRNAGEFVQPRKSLESMVDGRIEYDAAANHWQFKKGNQKFSIGVTAEGIKKIAILDTLLGNGYLSPDSVVFIDEPESALHPVAISELLDIIAALASKGMQFFIASHSYFVIKKLFLIAQENTMSIPVLSSLAGKWQQADLKDGMPDNPIIDESIRLYREEVAQVLA